MEELNKLKDAKIEYLIKKLEEGVSWCLEYKLNFLLNLYFSIRKANSFINIEY